METSEAMEISMKLRESLSLGYFQLTKLIIGTIAMHFCIGISHASEHCGLDDPAYESPYRSIDSNSNDFIAASIGDSITAAFDARRPLANREINWSTGTRNTNLVFSHALRLREILPEQRVRTRNFAVSGSKAPDVVRQAKRLAKYKPDYVTVLVGANDVCAWSDDHEMQLAKYESDIRTILSTLIASNDEVKILVSAIPNMPLLREIGVRNDCQRVWSTVNICPALLGADRTEIQRANFATRWQDANHVLERVSQEFPSHVKFAASVADPVFSYKHVSRIDCFHPNTEGQDFLAELTWQEGWY